MKSIRALQVWNNRDKITDKEEIRRIMIKRKAGKLYGICAYVCRNEKVR